MRIQERFLFSALRGPGLLAIVSGPFSKSKPPATRLYSEPRCCPLPKRERNRAERQTQSQSDDQGFEKPLKRFLHVGRLSTDSPQLNRRRQRIVLNGVGYWLARVPKR
jgi:hypothetical protein